ncbi:hypothetical protein C2G38_2175561 [Gigaspora rosea]|uniref:Uncharacterized protein n=1 Tax=Gigaspora rosea TaxID=44941 RepID=A0A397VH78_9GLOM|nr:hypothetical protein C2G38_2175561 [Gigaspora rosea]
MTTRVFYLNIQETKREAKNTLENTWKKKSVSERVQNLKRQSPYSSEISEAEIVIIGAIVEATSVVLVGVVLVGIVLVGVVTSVVVGVIIGIVIGVAS